MKKIIFYLLITGICFAQQTNYPSGNLSTDFKCFVNKFNKEKISNPQQNVKLKSPYIAGALSALIPGSGEIYNGDYFKAILFFAVEGISIYMINHYNKKGDNQTAYFQNFADEHWSVVRYAEWLNQWASALGGNANIHINPDANLKPWQRVNWDELNSAERTIREFSHTLYPYAHQQYYEMIGKYPQYSQGWDDSKFAKGIYSIAGEYYYDTKGNFIYYSSLRGKANEYYNFADKALIVLLTNHVISFVDAIISANRYNSKIKISAELKQSNFAGINDYYPELTLKLRF